MEPKEIILSDDIKKNETPRSLIEYLRDAVIGYSKRETLGAVKSEHSVFIPSAALEEAFIETTDFILLARSIRKNKEYGCPVTVEETNAGGHGGLEFVFGFSKFTDFDGILDLIEKKLSTTN